MRTEMEDSRLSEPPAKSALRRSSLWVLVAANLVPLAGVVFWDWKVHEVMFLYWLENIVVGVFNVFRMLACQGVETDFAGNVILAVLFSGHYGIFCWGHGWVLAWLFTGEDARQVSLARELWRLLHDAAGLAAVLAIVASHAYSFVRNFLLGGEFRGTEPGYFFARPYARIGATHVMLFLGGYLLLFLNSPLGAMAALVLGKIGFDAVLHYLEHKELAWKEA